MSDQGKVYFVGAGPGDPGLITVRGQQVIRQADVILADRLVNPRLLLEAPTHCQTIDVGKKPGGRKTAQEEIHHQLLVYARAGHTVVRLKGGDPFVFGRGGEEAAFLRKEGIPYEVIPGISSSTAVPAYAGIPVTHREASSSFTVVTGHENPDKRQSSVSWEHLAKGSETLVILMGVKHLPSICSELLLHGRAAETPVALIRWGTRANQETLTGTLDNIVQKVEQAQFQAPAVIVVGDVVQQREDVAWFEEKPLLGQRILIPRTGNRISPLSLSIEELGGEAVEVPVAKRVPTSGVEEAIRFLPECDALLFADRLAVDWFLRSYLSKGDIRDLSRFQMVALSRQAAVALQGYGIWADPMEGDAVLPDPTGGAPMLLHTGGFSGQLRMRWMGSPSEIREIPLGERRLLTEGFAQLLSPWLDGGIDWIAFTSSFAVDAWMRLFHQAGYSWESWSAPPRIACMGPESASTIRKYGLAVDAEAMEPTRESLVQGIVRAVSQPSVTVLEG